MASTGLIWIRRDLRVHDHPALSLALAEHERVVPVFVLDPGLLRGRFPSPARAAFLHACLKELGANLRARGGGLAIREGRPWTELPRLAGELGAATVYWCNDVSPYARRRDRRVSAELDASNVGATITPGNFIADIGRIRTGAGNPYRVFSPFHRAWTSAGRRALEQPPTEIRLPPRLTLGRLPSVSALGGEDPPQRLVNPGETAGRTAMRTWLREGLTGYADRHDELAGGTSELSPYLHFGCLSPLELESEVAGRRGAGPAEYRRQLAWRDFYAHLLLHHPGNARQELQPRYRQLSWDRDDDLLEAWKTGRTGYPVVDAAMRQLRRTGWMHNRARLIVGSFLTKDLHLDWRAGEQHFMQWLIDGDESNNNGNWQWIASVGADPAPYFRRLLNPTNQQRRHDPDGAYARRWLPELRDVPLEHLAEPWLMSEDEQRSAGCVIGSDYPAPVVDHAAERKRAIERYRSAGA